MAVDTDIVDLSGEWIVPNTPASVREAAKAALDAGATHYTDRPGISELREAVALKLAGANGIAVNPADEVLITCGVQEALFLAVQVLAGSEDEVIVAGPALRSDVELVRMVGAAARIAPPTKDLGLDIEQVAGLVDEHTKVILLRSPSAAGQVIPYTELETLGQLAVERDLHVIAVEADEALRAAGADAFGSIGAIAGLAGRTVTINGFGAVGLDAWRVGYLAAQREMIAPIKHLKLELSICSPAVSQHAAIDVIARADVYSATVRDRLDGRRAALQQALQHAGIEHVAYPAGPYVFVKPRAGISVQDTIARAAGTGIAVADGGLAGAPGWVRLTLAEEPARLRDAGSRLARVIDITAEEATG